MDHIYIYNIANITQQYLYNTVMSCHGALQSLICDCNTAIIQGTSGRFWPSATLLLNSCHSAPENCPCRSFSLLAGYPSHFKLSTVSYQLFSNKLKYGSASSAFRLSRLAVSCKAMNAAWSLTDSAGFSPAFYPGIYGYTTIYGYVLMVLAASTPWMLRIPGRRYTVCSTGAATRTWTNSRNRRDTTMAQLSSRIYWY